MSRCRCGGRWQRRFRLARPVGGSPTAANGSRLRFRRGETPEFSRETRRSPRLLRDRQRIAFTHEGGGFLALVSVNNDQEFVRADGRVSTQRAVGHDEIDGSVADPAAQQFGHVDGASLNAVVGADDAEAIPIVAVAATVVSTAVVPVIAITADLKHAHVHETAFAEVEFAFLVPSVPGKDAQRLVFPDGGIPAHGLVVHGDSAVYAATSYQVLEDIGDIVALILEAIIGALDLPAFFLGTRF